MRLSSFPRVTSLLKASRWTTFTVRRGPQRSWQSQTRRVHGFLLFIRGAYICRWLRLPGSLHFTVTVFRWRRQSPCSRDRPCPLVLGPARFRRQTRNFKDAYATKSAQLLWLPNRYVHSAGYLVGIVKRAIFHRLLDMIFVHLSSSLYWAELGGCLCPCSRDLLLCFCFEPLGAWEEWGRRSISC